MNLKIQIIKNLPSSSNSNSWGAHATPEHKPTLVMVADRWDDFGAETQFDVFLYLQDRSEYIGKTKIIHRSEDSGDGQYYYTKHLMEDEYDGELTDCCSLGQYE